jgi:hypothetical chaperone protein
MAMACGIDFGTSNSAVGVARNGNARLLALEGDATSVPTALFFSLEDDTRSHGREAMKRYLSQEPGRLMRSIKSLLGTSLWSETTQVKHRRYAFADIVADYLRFLREAAARELGGEPDSVVLGRPVFFVDDDAAADRAAQEQLTAAAHAAGFKHVELQLEPIAAALDYERGVMAEEIALVADIGGGTSDFSIVRVSPELAGKVDRRGDVLGTSGVHIGGTDFDRLLSMATLMPFLGLRSKLKREGMEAPSWYFADLATWHRVNFLYDQKVIAEVKTVRRDSAEPAKIERLLRVIEKRLGHEMLGRVEAAKIAIGEADMAPLSLSGVAQGLALRVERRRFERAIAECLDSIEGRIAEVIRQAGIEAGDICTVFMTGGSCGVPSVREAIVRGVPDARVVAGDAFGSVATGLALEAERRFGAG